LVVMVEIVIMTTCRDQNSHGTIRVPWWIN
jgi:hypothetical protein